MRDLLEVAQELGLSAADIVPWGPSMAKLRPEVAFPPESPALAGPSAPLVLVSALSPTPAGEGKTTCTIGLTQAARRLGVRAACALREPSLGPVFGQKGGGTGGGQAQLVPSERINLHFTGDLHAVTAAHNLLAALIDNNLYFRPPQQAPVTGPLLDSAQRSGAPCIDSAQRSGAPCIDGRQVSFRRVLDLNDRFLRRTVIGLGGKAMGVPREDGFDITAASEVMAILCLSRDYADLRARLGRILVGYTAEGAPVRAGDLGAAGAMAALLRDALLPNLVQTLEGAPALVHGGPFGNIAHGCNSLVATRCLLRRAEVVFTEAGFGFDLGAEKFLDIKCRIGGLWPRAVVLVATLRALKFHGGVPAAAAGQPDAAALDRGMANLWRHIQSVRGFGLMPIVAVNVRAEDAPDEIQRVLSHLSEAGVDAGAIDVFRGGGAGATELTARVLERVRTERPPTPRYLYADGDRPEDKIRSVAQKVYGAAEVVFTAAAQAQLERAVQHGFGELPVCIAKTHLSLSDNEKLVGRPQDFTMTVREVRVAAGAGFLVPLTGEILTMPGLPRRPHALDIDLLPDGTITGVG